MGEGAAVKAGEVGFWWDGWEEPLTRENLAEAAKELFRPRDFGPDDPFCHCCSEIEPMDRQLTRNGVTACAHCFDTFGELAAYVLAGRDP